MRPLLSIAAICAAVLLPSHAFGQVIKAVEVINTPLPVEVINPSSDGAAAFLGFSENSPEFGGPATFPGRLGLNQFCVDTFDPGAHMCTASELLPMTLPSDLVGEGWMDRRETAVSNDHLATDCNGWAGGSAGSTLRARFRGLDSFVGFGVAGCDESLPVACCR